MLTVAQNVGQSVGQCSSQQCEVGFDQRRVRLIGADDCTQLIRKDTVSDSHLHGSCKLHTNSISPENG